MSLTLFIEEPVLEKICDVYDRVKAGEWESIRIDKNETLDSLCSYLDVEKIEAAFFCVIFSLNYERGRPLHLDDIAKALNLTPVKLLLYKDILMNLCNKNSKGFPQGIAILLYGGPGTGKTESVYQLAKATGRAVFHVDIAATKSCWFGESEKIIRTLFKRYRRVCEESQKDGTKMPIIFFNEADAVLSKRRDVDSGNTAKTENTIQNIILEEMETLNGIMIATTNLTSNFDAAFERRFLFKIHIDQPTSEVRSKIWQNKIQLLSQCDAVTLAEEYNFSGGEIDNIVRKMEIENVIRGKVYRASVQL